MYDKHGQKNLLLASLLFMTLLIGMLFVGCKKEEESNDPKLLIEPLSLEINKSNQEEFLTLKNVGKSTLEWTVFDKPDWIILSSFLGECDPGDSTVISVLGNLSIGLGQYQDSLVISSSGGNGVIALNMNVDIVVPENALYSGRTTDELAFSYRIRYNRITDFNGSYSQSGQIITNNIPFFGKIVYNDQGFTVNGPQDMILDGSYNGINLISGTWYINEDRSIGYSILRQPDN